MWTSAFGAWTLLTPYTTITKPSVFVDATPRGEEPGTVYVIEPEIEEDGEVTLDTHGMDPVKVLRFARAMGAEPPRTLVVGCEPQMVPGRRGFEAPPTTTC